MTIFVAGIHGVGKTYLARRYAEKRNVIHATASSLIKEELAQANWNNNKLVSNIDENQSILIAAVRRHLANKSRLLLDGHFVLKDQNNQYVPISELVFHKLKIRGVVLIEATVDIIRERLFARDSTVEFADIDGFLRAEHDHAKEVCAVLKIPLIVLNNPSIDSFSAALDRLFGFAS